VSTNLSIYSPFHGRVGYNYGVYEIATALAKNETVGLFRLPKCRVIDGAFRGDAIDTDTSTPLMEITIGHEGNSVDTADPNAFFDSTTDPLDGAAIAGLKPETLLFYPFNGVLKDGPYALSEETVISAKCTAEEAAGGTGTLHVGAYYIEPAS
jgi:hypothetical protein